ncbi:hypothetical protein TNCV_4210941 [Trichonephila clavipes]|nr:hypothetical protein TNCV_4210941 [Trichonephila clavipes]
MGNLLYAKNANKHYMYGLANGNGRATLPMYRKQFPDRRMLDHRIFLQLHRQISETRTFHITRRDAMFKKLYAVRVWRKAPLTLWLIHPSQVQVLLLIT